MLKKTISAVFAAMAVIGCNEKNLEVPETTTREKVQLTVRIPEEVTKVTGTSSDGKVNDLQVFVFDRNGVTIDFVVFIFPSDPAIPNP